jgi:hypothetical protein
MLSRPVAATAKFGNVTAFRPFGMNLQLAVHGRSGFMSSVPSASPYPPYPVVIQHRHHRPRRGIPILFVARLSSRLSRHRHPVSTRQEAKIACFGVTKRGNAYLRMLLVHGARSVVQQAGEAYRHTLAMDT